MTTANLDSINVSSAGFFALAKDSKDKLVPLIQTRHGCDAASPSSASSSCRIRAQLLDGFTPTQDQLRDRGASGRQIHHARFRIARTKAHLAEAKDNGEIILAADTDMLTDRLWVNVQPFFGQKLMNAFANNGDFFINAVDNLTGSTRSHLDPRPRDFAASVHARRRHEARRRRDVSAARNRSCSSSSGHRAQADRTAERQDERQRDDPVARAAGRAAELPEKKVEIRKQLRQVQRSLDENIEALGARLKLINIGLMPLLVTIAALAFAFWKKRRRAV